MGGACRIFKTVPTEPFGQSFRKRLVDKEIQGISVMYRENDRSSVGGDLSRNDGWQDWPPETRSARFEGEPGPASSEVPKGREISYYRQPDAPVVTGELASPRGQEAQPGGARRRGRARRKVALVLGALLVLGVAGWYGDYWWTTGRYLVSTDDAYVGAKNATLAAKITGYVADVAVDDNAHVHEGDVIARIDDGDYQLAVKTARDNIATQQATVDRIGKQVAAQQAAVDRRRRSSFPRMPARRAPSSSSSASATSPHAASGASKRLSRRKPTETRRLPRCSPIRQRSRQRRPRSMC